MGLRSLEIKTLTLVCFTQELQGYQEREDEEWDRTRHLMSFILNYSGMGTGKYTSPQELLTLPKDKRGEDIVAPVNSDFKAYEILDTFKQL